MVTGAGDFLGKPKAKPIGGFGLVLVKSFFCLVWTADFLWIVGFDWASFLGFFAVGAGFGW